MSEEETGRRTETAPRDLPAEVRELNERMDRAYQLIEILQERTNTLTRLLGLMGQRVDRLEPGR